MLRKIVSNTIDRLARGSRTRRLVSAGRPGAGDPGGGASGPGRHHHPDAEQPALALGRQRRRLPLPLRPAPPDARRDHHLHRPAELRPDGENTGSWVQQSAKKAPLLVVSLALLPKNNAGQFAACAAGASTPTSARSAPTCKGAGAGRRRAAGLGGEHRLRQPRLGRGHRGPGRGLCPVLAPRRPGAQGRRAPPQPRVDQRQEDAEQGAQPRRHVPRRRRGRRHRRALLRQRAGEEHAGALGQVLRRLVQRLAVGPRRLAAVREEPRQEAGRGRVGPVGPAGGRRRPTTRSTSTTCTASSATTPATSPTRPT